MSATVRTQVELDAALKVGGVVVIDSPRDVWMELRASGTATVYASGTATVRAYGTATVHAYDTATVRASGTATVRAYGTATVRAYGTATVYAYDTATVYAYDTATVYAYDTATVRAHDTATVYAYDTATVRAHDTATVRAHDTATVHAARYVAVHLFSRRATLRGGVLIDTTAVDITNLEDWSALTGATIADGKVTLYKAVDNDLNSGRGFAYPIGKTVTCNDFNDRAECGGGLHLSPTPWQARDYFASATRYLKCRVNVADLVIIDRTKVKARRVKVVREVDLNMRPVKGVKP